MTHHDAITSTVSTTNDRSLPQAMTTNDAGRVIDSVVALRQLLTALDSASYALQAVNDEGLTKDLSDIASRVLLTVERLERTPTYLNARKDYFTDASNS